MRLLILGVLVSGCATAPKPPPVLDPDQLYVCRLNGSVMECVTMERFLESDWDHRKASR